METKDNFLLTADTAIEKGTSESSVKQWVNEVIGIQKKSAFLSLVTKVRWAAIISATLDLHFEDGFRQETDRHPNWHPVTILSDLTTSPPPRTVPVFKLLGVPTREDFAFSTVSYLDRRATWRHAVKGFADSVKGNPVLCLGMSDAVWALTDLIAEMIGERSSLPSSLLFLADDPVCGNTQIHKLLNRRSRILTVRGTAGDVARAAADADNQGFARSCRSTRNQVITPLPSSGSTTPSRLWSMTSWKARIGKSEQHQLRDLLFSPAVPRWDPFVHGLDFQRTLSGDLTQQISTMLQDSTADSEACVLYGGAVTGKTVLLKRLAWNLASAGSIVLWLKPWTYQEGSLACCGNCSMMSRVSK